MSAASQAPGADGERIDVADTAALAAWASRLDVSETQVRDAVAACGDRAADVEMYLKGSHSTTNADKTEQAGGG